MNDHTEDNRYSQYPHHSIYTFYKLWLTMKMIIYDFHSFLREKIKHIPGSDKDSTKVAT